MSPTQKRLTRILLALAITGSFVIGALWWDSTSHMITWSQKKFIVMSASSSLTVDWTPFVFEAIDYAGLSIGRIPSVSSEDETLFPIARLYSAGGKLPYYLVFLLYIAYILLTWLLLMNRLARRKAFEESRASSRLP